MKEHLFWEYVKQHAAGLLLLTAFAAIFAIVLFLGNVPPSVFGYAALLCLVMGGVAGGVGFWRFCRRHRTLCALRERVNIGLPGLPSPEGLLEQDYAELLQLMELEKRHAVSEAARTQSEMIEYYTLWAHQIKTPITAMRVILQSDGGAENAALEAQLLSIEQYVDMVLSYLRLDSDQSDFVFAEYPLEDIVKQAVRHFAKLFIRKKIALHMEPMPQRVLTDRKWLEFVLEQLLANALKYTGEGGSITLRVQSPCTLSVEDTGIGIAAEDLPRVFDRGYTGYNGRGDNKSTGIGLYLCRRTMDKLGHTLAITSEVGVGTKVLLGLDKVKTQAE